MIPHTVCYNADKSKCLQPFVISGNKIECVPRWSHLGHALCRLSHFSHCALCKDLNVKASVERLEVCPGTHNGKSAPMSTINVKKL